MIPLNTQPAEKATKREDGLLDIAEVFVTIQGEGPFAGRRAVFIRTAGCNLQCPLCDTDYTSKRRLMGVEEIVNKVKELLPPFRVCSDELVVITGGEPFRQPMGELVRRLLFSCYIVQFETNGTLYDESMEGLWGSVSVVCCPKSGSVNEKLKPNIRYWKYVVQKGMVDANDGLPLTSLGYELNVARPDVNALLGKSRIYVQPCDEGNEVANKANIAEAVRVCQEHGYTLSLQTHKLVGLP